MLLNVAARSARKTKAVNLLDGVTNGRLNEITSAGLLGWSTGHQLRHQTTPDHPRPARHEHSHHTTLPIQY